MKPEYNPDLFYDWIEVPVRYRDLDPLNHVNNAIFSSYYEEARIHFIQKVPALADELQHQRSFVIVNININFIKQVTYPATLLIGTGIMKVGNTSVTSFQAIYTKDSKELCSTAKAKGVWFDLNKQRPAPLPISENMDKLLVNDTRSDG